MNDQKEKLLEDVSNILHEFHREMLLSGDAESPLGRRVIKKQYAAQILSRLQSSTEARVKEELRVEVALMREPMPSANDHAEYNRGVRKGVEIIRNAIVSLLTVEQEKES